MKRLDNALANYLERETDYAMMITGKWGSGKTYYYENVLKKKIIEKTPTLVKDNNKNFKPILVSLYGLKSLEEVKKSIILSLIPLSNISENKWLKLGSNFVTSVLGATNINIGFNDNLSIKTDLGKVMSKSDIDKDDWINLEDLVICFDDLERIHPTFDIQELIGYINHIVETAKAKILIIANDKEIEDEKFKVLKEKTIGISIEFIPDFDTMYQSIIDNSIVKDTQYHIFLEKKKELVKTVFGENSENYRILIFALNHFQNIYSELSPFLANNKEKESFLNSKKQEILEKLLRFTIAISIEYREGKISYGDRKGLNLYYPPIYQKIASLEEKRVLSSEDKDYLSKYKRYTKCIESIKNKYNVRFNSDFINSIYGYVTGGNVLKIDELVKEIKSQYDVENEILGKLHYEQVLKHSDEEYKNLTKQMLNFAYEGKYKLEHYYYIFQYAFRFENPLNLNAEKVEKI